jgi:hypothetical protein
MNHALIFRDNFRETYYLTYIATCSIVWPTDCAYKIYFWHNVVDWEAGGGSGRVASIGVAQPTPDSSTVLVLNKFNPTDEDSFVFD